MPDSFFVKIFRSLPVFLPEERERRIALALGHFDGVHLGHQAMLTRVCEAASDLDLVPSVLTFEPSPREFFLKEKAPPKLLSLRERLLRMEAIGIKRVYLLRFDERMADMTASDFVDRFLTEKLRVGWLLLSEESRFGKGREGCLDFVRSKKTQFSVEAIHTVPCWNKQRISSTRIREALAKSDFATARQLLGHPYALSGFVRHGDKRGRTLGFPTMNLPLKAKPALTGVFAVRVHGLGAPLAGVASLGVRPTVKGQGAQPVLEVHLFDFNEDVYGRPVEVEFIARIRDEQRFADLAALTRQMEHDALVARRYLSENHAI